VLLLLVCAMIGIFGEINEKRDGWYFQRNKGWLSLSEK
jgi:hypothetical protein